MDEEILHRRSTTLVRRLRLEPGEATHWHRDACHKVTVVLEGDSLEIQYRDGAPADRFRVTPGQTDWDEPTDRVHRGVNRGSRPYVEIAVFLLDAPDVEPQPGPHQ